jgi:hypothetical protein
MLRATMRRAHAGWQEIVALTLLYGLYEVVRGWRNDDLAAASDHDRPARSQFEPARPLLQPARRGTEPASRVRGRGRRSARVAGPQVWRPASGVLYPFVALFVIVATGNYFYFDAATEAAVAFLATIAAWELTIKTSASRHQTAEARVEAENSPTPEACRRGMLLVR